jgi:hypothetical protein
MTFCYFSCLGQYCFRPTSMAALSSSALARWIFFTDLNSVTSERGELMRAFKSPKIWFVFLVLVIVPKLVVHHNELSTAKREGTSAAQGRRKVWKSGQNLCDGYNLSPGRDKVNWCTKIWGTPAPTAPTGLQRTDATRHCTDAQCLLFPPLFILFSIDSCNSSLVQLYHVTYLNWGTIP